MKKFLFITLIFLALYASSQATTLEGATCNIEFLVKEVGSEKKQTCGGVDEDRNCREYESPYIVINIQRIDQITDCSFVKLGDDFKLDSGGDLSLLSKGDIIQSDVEKADSLTPSGVSSFIQWSDIKVIKGDKTLPNNYSLQGDAAPIEASK